MGNKMADAVSERKRVKRSKFFLRDNVWGRKTCCFVTLSELGFSSWRETGAPVAANKRPNRSKRDRRLIVKIMNDLFYRELKVIIIP